MRRRTSTTIAATTALALMISLVSVDRAEARRWGIGAGIATALILAASSTSIAQTAKEGTKAPELSKERKLSLCVESWDATTHMSKQEWRIACQRSIKDYPDAFER